MPQTPHVERHFTASEAVRDIVIGMSDGLTVPFALAAGLSGVANSTAIVITGGGGRDCSGLHCHGFGRVSGSRRGLWPGQRHFEVKDRVRALQF